MITLISYITAREGFRFVFTGPSKECLGCRFRRVCVDKLKVGQIYEVTKVYGILNKCPINEYVVTVDVKEAEIEVAMSRRTVIEGAIVNYSKMSCDNVKCPNHSRCSSNLVIKPLKVKIVKVLGNVTCPKNLELSNVLVRIVEP